MEPKGSLRHLHIFTETQFIEIQLIREQFIRVHSFRILLGVQFLQRMSFPQQMHRFSDNSIAVCPHHVILELLVDVTSWVWAVRGGRSHADLILDTEH